MGVNAIQKILDEAHKLASARQGLFSLEDVIQVLDDREITLQPAEVGEILSHEEFIEWECPLSLVSFICDYARASAPASRLLDVWASGRLVLDLLNVATPDEAIALCPDPKLAALGAHIAGSDRVQWRVGDPVAEIRKTDGPFDLIVGCLPVGLGPREEAEVAFSGKVARINDWKPNIAIAEACSRLAARVGSRLVSAQITHGSPSRVLEDILPERDRTEEDRRPLRGGSDRLRLVRQPAAETGALARYSFKRLCAAQSRCHNAETFSTPRRRNCRSPRPCLICPNTGSADCSRLR